ncbi:MAG: thiamine diphosphokinase [Solobacterium sp.]|nr:thiamine diphosphokinase [Solobacterium sp.]
MNKQCVIVLGMADTLVQEADTDYIGADHGSLVLADAGIRMVCAIGDFDSVSEAEVQRIQSMADEFIRMNPVKNDSDSEAVVRYAIEKGYRNINVYGALGGRIDHEIVNLKLAEEFAGILTLVNEQNSITALNPGIYPVNDAHFKFFSIFALVPSVVTYEGFKYPLDHRTINPGDLYGVSNELLDHTGTLTVHSGKVLAIHSRD